MEPIFNPHDPTYLLSRSGSDVPEPMPVTVLPGQARHPTVEQLQYLLACDEPGSLAIPAPILLVNSDAKKATSRTPFMAKQLWIPNRERCRHSLVMGPTGAGKNQKLIDHLALNSIRSSLHSCLAVTGKKSSFDRLAFEARKVGKKVVTICLADPSISTGFDPLATRERSLARQYVETISKLNSNPRSSDSPFFQGVVSLALLGCWDEGYRSLPAIRSVLSLPTRELKSVFASSNNASFRKLSEMLDNGTNSNLDTCQATIAKVLETMLPGNSDRVFGNNEIDLEQLWSRGPVVVLMLVPQDRVDAYLAANGYAISSIADAALRAGETAGEESAQPLDFFFEDLLSVGPFLSFEKLLAYRSRNIGVVAGAQSIVGMQAAYGQTEGRTLYEGFVNKIVLPGVDPKDACELSAHSGTQRVYWEHKGATQVFEQAVLTPDEIRNPTYEHFLLGRPATFFLAGKSFQAYLQNAFEAPENRHLYCNDRNIACASHRSTPLPNPSFTQITKKKLIESHETDTNGWTESEFAEFLRSTLNKVGFDDADPVVQESFREFIADSEMRIAVKLLDELVFHQATIQEFYDAHARAKTNNLQGILYFMLAFRYGE